MKSYAILGAIIIMTLIGDFALKYASMKQFPLASLWLLSGIAIYGSTAIGWVYLMQTRNLGQIAVLYSSATILALTAVGFIFFNETLTTKQLVGSGAAMLSIFLMELGA